MFKRIMLTLTFVAAFSIVGVGLTNTAEAWRGGWGWGRPYRAYYGYGPRAAYYGSGVPYRAFYGPRFVRPYYNTSYYASSYYAYPAYSDYCGYGY